MMSKFSNLFFIALVALVTTVAGCSSGNIGTVTGTITADGKPLQNAMVTFYPRPEGRASGGLTDENGEYELTYTREVKGAVVGEHMVQITTAVETGDYGEMNPETVPAKYNVGSELIETVKAGRNVINFELELGGEIIESAY